MRAWLGLGGNLGNPQAAMGTALRALDAHADCTVAVVSDVYRTPPWGLRDQPDFLNACAGLDTALGARALLDLALSVERGLKRERSVRWGPRVIDIDILLFGEEAIDEPGLQVPHPRMDERAFVLVPLAEIAPGLKLGGVGVADRAAALDRSGITALGLAKDWWRAEG